MKKTLTIKINQEYIHYYLDNVYIGMLVFKKGELSDFKAIIRKNRINIDEETIYATIKTSFYALLNHYLVDSLFILPNELESLKSQIVHFNENELQRTSEEIIYNKIVKVVS